MLQCYFLMPSTSEKQTRQTPPSPTNNKKYLVEMTSFKRFNAEVDDILTSPYNDIGTWSMTPVAKRTNKKTEQDQWCIKSEGGNSGVAVTIEYAPGSWGCPVRLKTRVTRALKWTATAIINHQHGHKAQISTNKAFEHTFEYDWKCAPFYLHEKLTKKAFDCDIAWKVAGPVRFHIGAGCKVRNLRDDASRNVQWSFGGRYQPHDACLLNLVTRKEFKEWTLGSMLHFEVAGRQWTTAAQIDGNTTTKQCTSTVGVQADCSSILPANSTVSVRLSDKRKWAVALETTVPAQWKIALSIDSSLKTGLSLTQE